MVELWPKLYIYDLSEEEQAELHKQVESIVDEYLEWLDSYRSIDYCEHALVNFLSCYCRNATLTGFMESMVGMNKAGIGIPRSLYDKIASIPDLDDLDDFVIHTSMWPFKEEDYLIDETK